MSDSRPGDAHIFYGEYLNLDDDEKRIMRVVIKQMLKNAEIRNKKGVDPLKPTP